MNTNRSAVLVFQNDGNVVLYRIFDKVPLWDTKTNGQKTSQLSSVGGSLVLSKMDGSVAWTSAWDADWGWGHGDTILQDDGDLVIRNGTTNTWSTFTYGLRYPDENKSHGWRPLHTFDDPTQLVGDAIHQIPGVDWAGQALKDIANSLPGKIVLVAFTSSMYYATSSVVAAYTAMAPQIAGLAFAIPGLAAGDKFSKAWLEGFVERVKRTIEYLGGDAGKEAGKEMLKEIGPTITELLNNSQLQAVLAEVVNGAKTLQSLADQMGIRADVLQSAIDLVKRQASSFANDVIKGFGIGGIFIPDVPATPGLMFDPLTGSLIKVRNIKSLVMSVNPPPAPKLATQYSQIKPNAAAPISVSDANANIAAYQAKQLADPTSWLAKQKVIDAQTVLKAAATARAQFIATNTALQLVASTNPTKANKRAAYFSKYLILATK
jgi:hypothetical protein